MLNNAPFGCAHGGKRMEIDARSGRRSVNPGAVLFDRFRAKNEYVTRVTHLKN